MVESDTFQLAYLPDLDVLAVRWLADSHLSWLAAVHLHGTARWLLDVRRRPSADPEASHWVVFEWMLRAAATFQARLRLVVLASPQRIELVRTEPTLQVSAREALRESRSYYLRLFADEAAVITWLTSEAPD
jgi:hypothetical protein